MSDKQKVIDGIKFEIVQDTRSFEVCSDVAGKTEGQIGLIKIHAWDVTYNIDRKHIQACDDGAKEILDANTIDGRFVWKVENKDKYGY